MKIELGQKFAIDGDTYQVVDKVDDYWFLLPINEDGSLGETVDGMLKTSEDLNESVEL